VRSKTIETHKIILQAAKKVFLSKGFAAASMSQIAKEAGITKPLLFYHCKSKEELWKSVKESILGLNLAEVELPRANYKEFIEYVVDLRFKMYGNNPDLVRMLQWQRLDSSEGADIAGTYSLPKNIWLNYLIYFQEREQIIPSIDVEVLQTMIFSLSTMPFMENADWVEDKNKLEYYKNCVISILLSYSM